MSVVFNDPIHIVGAGVSGSRIARLLAEKGRECVRELHLWDDDVVELGNIRHQTYLPAHIGRPKVEALAEQVKAWGDIEAIPHREYIDGPRPLSGTVFSCVDKMSRRWIVWKDCVRDNDAVSLMIEMRLEEEASIIHVVDPRSAGQRRKWELYSEYSDDEATTAGLSCGAATSHAPIGELTATLCVGQLVRAVDIRAGADDRLDNQIRVFMRPPSIERYQW